MKKTITKADIVEEVYQRSQMWEKGKTKKYIENLIELIKDSLISENFLLITGFGRFQVLHKKERKGRNPQTEEPIMLAPRTVCVFKVSKKFKKELNQHTE